MPTAQELIAHIQEQSSDLAKLAYQSLCEGDDLPGVNLVVALDRSIADYLSQLSDLLKEKQCPEVSNR